MASRTAPHSCFCDSPGGRCSGASTGVSVNVQDRLQHTLSASPLQAPTPTAGVWPASELPPQDKGRPSLPPLRPHRTRRAKPGRALQAICLPAHPSKPRLHQLAAPLQHPQQPVKGMEGPLILTCVRAGQRAGLVGCHRYRGKALWDRHASREPRQATSGGRRAGLPRMRVSTVPL